MKYKASDIAKEWSVSPEAVRRYIREIKQDPELLAAGLIEETRSGVLITESGKEWISKRRTHWKETARKSDDEEVIRLKKRIEELEESERFLKGRIEHYERHTEELLSALTRQQYLALSYTSTKEESPSDASYEPVRAEYEDKKDERKKQGFFKRLFHRS